MGNAPAIFRAAQVFGEKPWEAGALLSIRLDPPAGKGGDTLVLEIAK